MNSQFGITKKARTDNIKKSIESLNLEFLLNNKTVSRQVSNFIETITSTAAVVKFEFTVYRVKFSELFLCYKQNLLLSGANYINKEYQKPRNY